MNNMKKLLLALIVCGFTANAADAILSTNTIDVVTLINMAEKVDIEKVKTATSTNWVFRLWGAEFQRVRQTKQMLGNPIQFVVTLTNNPTGWIAVWQAMKADAVAQRAIDKAAQEPPGTVD